MDSWWNALVTLNEGALFELSAVKNRLEQYCHMMDDGQEPPVDIVLISLASRHFFDFTESERDAFHRYNNWIIEHSRSHVNSQKKRGILEKNA